MSNSGNLFDMAKDGTTIPGDAGKQNTVPSVASPHQKKDTADGLGKPELHEAADNEAAITAGVGEGISATGHSLPESTTSKPFGKGHGGKSDK